MTGSAAPEPARIRPTSPGRGSAPAAPTAPTGPVGAALGAGPAPDGDAPVTGRFSRDGPAEGEEVWAGRPAGDGVIAAAGDATELSGDLAPPVEQIMTSPATAASCVAFRAQITGSNPAIVLISCHKPRKSPR
ncbi:hypothetical protein Sme01_08730 [Sphaerisporangium melleum]|uniref:Uncharacterized protein n=1 Tax=Sphaerisporangium melleum TaxID=321316 RepID=A0A917QWN0_9ACTN|nr:hypothetical protein GCM10007964_13460 [Sphaerisporangium melleum]GII68397.1 hypothetical protein Sme01_08730 [Sphaerisporangium melleum]